MRCVVTRTVVPSRRSCPNTSHMSSRALTSRPVLGSSRIRSRGRWRRDLAISTSPLEPPGESLGLVPPPVRELERPGPRRSALRAAPRSTRRAAPDGRGSPRRVSLGSRLGTGTSPRSTGGRHRLPAGCRARKTARSFLVRRGRIVQRRRKSVVLPPPLGPRAVRRSPPGRTAGKPGREPAGPHSGRDGVDADGVGAGAFGLRSRHGSISLPARSLIQCPGLSEAASCPCSASAWSGAPNSMPCALSYSRTWGTS